MSKTMQPLSRSIAYGLTLGCATSPGLALQVTPVDTVAQTSGTPVVIRSKNDLLRVQASKLEQVVSLIANVGTGGTDPFTRCWVEAASESSDTQRESDESRSTSDAVAVIRAALSLQVKELAKVLDVSRPTIYSWLRNEEQPQPQNRTRIAQLFKIAKAWNSLSGKPIGAAVRDELGADGKSLVELLTVKKPDNIAILSRMQQLAGKQDDTPKGIHEIAKRHGIDLTKVRESQAEFDVLTGKPFHED